LSRTLGAAHATGTAPQDALAGPRDRYAPALQGSGAAEPQLRGDPAEHPARPRRGPAVSLPHLLLGDVELDGEDIGALWRAQRRRRRPRDHLLHRDLYHRTLQQDLAENFASPPPLGLAGTRVPRRRRAWRGQPDAGADSSARGLPTVVPRCPDQGEAGRERS